MPWTADQLFAYLRNGYAGQHGAAAGPMREVVRDLVGVPDQDLRAIATYVASFVGEASPEQKKKASAVVAQAQQRSTLVAHAGMGRETTGAAPSARMPGAAIYAGACANCHNSRGTGYTSAVDLSLTTDVNADTPRNLIQVILQGIQPPPGERGVFMPSFAGSFTDQQMEQLIAYVRSTFSQHGPWSNVQDEIAKVRKSGDAS